MERTRTAVATGSRLRENVGVPLSNRPLNAESVSVSQVKPSVRERVGVNWAPRGFSRPASVDLPVVNREQRQGVSVNWTRRGFASPTGVGSESNRGVGTNGGGSFSQGDGWGRGQQSEHTVFDPPHVSYGVTTESQL